MAKLSEPSDEVGADEELTVTDHRDAAEERVSPEEEQDVETAEDGPREALEVLGEDVASSPAQRGQTPVEGDDG